MTSGWGADGAIRWEDLSLSGGWALYWVNFDGQPQVEDWAQQRGHVGVTYGFGREPVVNGGGYP